MIECECECECHGRGAYAPCSIEGGCGHLHPERRCVRGDRCVKRERDNPERRGVIRWVGAQLTEAAGICPACATHVSHAIGNLAGDVVELTMLMGATGSGGSEMVSGSPELPVPIRLGIEALRAEIDYELQYWAEVVAAATGGEWDSTAAEMSRQPQRVQKAANYLVLRVDTLVKLPLQERCAWNGDGEPLRDPWGDRDTVAHTGLDGALHLLELHQRVYRVAGRTHLVHRLTPACPWCDQRTLVRHNGSDVVECESCGKQIDEKHYSWFVIVTVAEEKRRKEAAVSAI